MKKRSLKRKYEEIEDVEVTVFLQTDQEDFANGINNSKSERPPAEAAPNGTRSTLVVKLPIRATFDQSTAQFRLAKASSIPFRLFDLPQELQDEVFAFTYPENGGREIVLREKWQAAQMRAQKRDGTLPAACPPHKVNEWLVSKRFFRAAARAWAKAQDLSTKDKCFELRLRGFGIFTEFATSAWLTVLGLPFGRVVLPSIDRFRALKKLVCIVDYRFFKSIDRGFAWELKFTDDELEALLEFAGMGVPSGLVELHLRPPSTNNYSVYFRTAEDHAMYASSLASLERLMWRRKLADPQDMDLANPERLMWRSAYPRDIEQDTLYPGSRVKYQTLDEDPPAGTEDIEQTTFDLNSKAQRDTTLPDPLAAIKNVEQNTLVPSPKVKRNTTLASPVAGIENVEQTTLFLAPKVKRSTTGEISLVRERSIVVSSTHMTSIVVLVTVAFILDVIFSMDIGKCNGFPLLGGALILAVCSVGAFASP